MKKINISILSTIIGLIIGSWITIFIIRGMIFENFSNDIGLRNDFLDDIILVPMFFIVLITFVSIVGMAIWYFIRNKK